MKKVLLPILLLLTLTSCGSGIVTIYAQSLPITKTVAWDANPASDNVTNYTVKLDSVTVGNPTGTTQQVTFTTAGAHSITTTATNIWGTSAPSALSVNVVIPANPNNLRIQ